MSVEGIWTSEIMGLFGWETIGVLALENGRAIGGGTHHYSIGSYSVDRDAISLDVEVRYHGTPRTIFGASDKKLQIEATLRINGNTMEGRAHRIDSPEQYVTYKLTRRADIPPIPD